MNNLSKKIHIATAVALTCLCARALCAESKYIDLPNFVVPVSQPKSGTVELSANGDSLYGFEDQKFCDQKISNQYNDNAETYQTCRGGATVALDNDGNLEFGDTGDTAVQIIDLGIDGSNVNFDGITATEINKGHNRYVGAILLPNEKNDVDANLIKNLVIVRSASEDSYTGAMQIRTCTYTGENTVASSSVKPGRVYLVRAYSYFYWKKDGPNSDQYQDAITKIKILSLSAGEVKIAYQVLTELWPSTKASPYSPFQPVSFPTYDFDDLMQGYGLSDSDPAIDESLLMSDRHLLSFDRPGKLDCNSRLTGPRPNLLNMNDYARKMETK